MRNIPPLIAAPANAAAPIFSARRILFLRSLVAGGIPTLCAMTLALSLRSPSLTAEYSGFTKKSTLSKYSHWVSVISTTCLLIPLIKATKSPLEFHSKQPPRKAVAFTLLFLTYTGEFILFFQCRNPLFFDFFRCSVCKPFYTCCIIHIFTLKVENRVEKVDNQAVKACFINISTCG